MPSGSVDITISFMGIQIFSKSEDLCSKTACPIKPGDLEIVLVEDLPPIAPPVSITQLPTLQASMCERSSVHGAYSCLPYSNTVSALHRCPLYGLTFCLLP